MKVSTDHWLVNKAFATDYQSPLDRELYCDVPLMTLLGDLTNQNVLDIGCGNGQLTKVMAQNAKKVIGVDTSDEMLRQAKMNLINVKNLQFVQASADQLTFDNKTFDTVVASMLINTLSKADTVKNIFMEVRRILVPSGRFIITMPHPRSLDRKTKFRWTEWEENQSLQNLVSGESFTRKFMGKNEKILSVTNNYWSPEVLINIAKRFGFSCSLKLEPKATPEDLLRYPKLDPALLKTPFFLLLIFVLHDKKVLPKN